MVTRGGVRVRLLLAVALIVGLFGSAVLRALTGPVPHPGWAGVVVLAFMAVGVYCAALPVKRLREGRARSPLSPLRAARSLVLGQAAALTGAGLLGWYAAQAATILPDLDIDSQRARFLLLAGHAVAALVLVVAGMLAQRMCRIDEDPRDEPRAAEGRQRRSG